jgi:hypothetical protein
MDTMKMSVAIEQMGMLSALFIGGVAICSVVIIIVVHISFAVAIFRDATNLPAPRKPISVSPTIWLLATLLGGIFVVTLYWIMHHSRLNQSVAATPPEN